MFIRKKRRKIPRFPIYEAGYIFNSFQGSNFNYPEKLQYKGVNIDYPCRLDAMAIDPSAVAYNEKMYFTPGEVVISINNFIHTNVRVIHEFGGDLKISPRTRRKVLVKHAYILMTRLLHVNPSLEIDIDDNSIPKHCGFGSSSSTISSVCCAINELYGKPIKDVDLIRFIASNHGEELSDQNESYLKAVQSIGGGASSGLIKEGILILAGRSTPIAKMNYNAVVLIGMPKDFKQKDASELMALEEENLWKFEKTGQRYKDVIAYNLLHKALPSLANNNIKDLSDIIFEYRFDMGSIDNCSFVYPNMVKLAKRMRTLYENNLCSMLSLSSVGPAFFVLVESLDDMQKCKKFMEDLHMNVFNYSVFNSTYYVKGIV